MKRLVLAVLILVPIAGAACAEGPPAPAGRYQIAPDKDGFVRLDTETGALSHCMKGEGTWRCDTIAEDDSALAARLDGLVGEIGALGTKLDGLTKRVEAVESGLAAAPAAFPKDEEIDRALTFAERLMQRFFEMVRRLKSEEAAEGV